MNSAAAVLIISCMGITITALAGIMIAHTHSDKRKVTSTHKITLSLDEQRFRMEILEEVDVYKAKIETLMENLRKINEELKADNIKLLDRMEKLQVSLDQANNKT